MNTWNGWWGSSLQGERSDVFKASRKRNYLMQCGHDVELRRFHIVTRHITLCITKMWEYPVVSDYWRVKVRSGTGCS